MDAALDPVDVAFAGVLGQRALLHDGRLTAVELLDLCLARIARLNGRLNAFRATFPERARAEAEAADRARADGDNRPLLGVPVAVKDNVRVAGHAPSMGTASPEPVAGRDAELVRRLRAAGAVVVGTTHLPELALWPFTESHTWGPTRNPWSTRHTPGGSSGGSAAAVAAGLVAAATASDEGGSLRIPAAACGLVGLKPHRDRVPLAPTTSTGTTRATGVAPATTWSVWSTRPRPSCGPSRSRDGSWPPSSSAPPRSRSGVHRSGDGRRAVTRWRREPWVTSRV